LVESLRSEDYEEEGLLELTALQEAIFTVNEELDQNIIDYLLYYVLMRSESHQRMQYKHLIELLDSLIASKSSQAPSSQATSQAAPQAVPQAAAPQTAPQKPNNNRPQSSSIDKIKMRNNNYKSN